MGKLNISKSLTSPKTIKSNAGFTLLELLVVVFILGVLGTVTLPNTLRQVSKARETEGKNNLGLLTRAQQVYHFEKGSFAASMNNLQSIVTIQSYYYNFPNPSVANNTIVKHQATGVPDSLVRNYAGGVYFNAGVFDTAICESTNASIPVDVPDVVSDPCTNGGTRIR